MNDAQPIALAQAAETVSKNAVRQGLHELAENPTFRETGSGRTPQPKVRSIVQTFSSGREAKEYLIAQIVMEAEREGTPLSETERKMLYFSETAWTLPNIWEVNEAFERDYDQPAFEAKVGRIGAHERGRPKNRTYPSASLSSNPRKPSSSSLSG